MSFRTYKWTPESSIEELRALPPDEAVRAARMAIADLRLQAATYQQWRREQEEALTAFMDEIEGIVAPNVYESDYREVGVGCVLIVAESPDKRFRSETEVPSFMWFAHREATIRVAAEAYREAYRKALKENEAPHAQ